MTDDERLLRLRNHIRAKVTEVAEELGVSEDDVLYEFWNTAKSYKKSKEEDSE